MTDSYYANVRKIEMAIRELNQDVEERNTLAGNPGLAIKKDTVIKNQIKNVQKIIDQVLEELDKCEKEKEKHNLTGRELAVRRKKIFDFRNEISQIQVKLNGLFRNKSTKFDEEYKEKAKFSERYNTDDMSEKQVKDLTKTLHDEQEGLLDAIGETVSVMKDGQYAMKKELEYQNKELLPDIEIGVDRNASKIQNNSERVIKLLQSSSNCTYYTMISFLTILLFLQLFIF